jgi:hypothetical protein
MPGRIHDRPKVCGSQKGKRPIMLEDQGVKLHVLVYDASRELCRVAMPTASADNLAHLFPDEDLAVVRSNGVDLEKLSQRAIDSGYAPQILVDTHTPNRSYRIWLE